MAEPAQLVVRGRFYYANRLMCSRSAELYAKARVPGPAEASGPWLELRYEGRAERGEASAQTRAVQRIARHAVGGFVDVVYDDSLGVRVRAGGSWRKCAPRLPRGARQRLGTLAFRSHDAVSALAYSSDGRQLASAGQDGEICLWDTYTGRLLHQLVGHQAVATRRGEHARVFAVRFSADNRMLASCGQDGTWRTWDVESGRQLKKRSAARDGVFDLSLSLDAGLLACAAGREVQLWDPHSGRSRESLNCGHEVRRVLFSPDGERLVALTAKGPCLIFELAHLGDGPRVRISTDFGFDEMALAPDGRVLALSAPNTPPTLWDPTTGHRLDTLASTGDRLLEHFGCLAFTPDGQQLAVYVWGANDPAEGFVANGVRLWELAAGRYSPLFDGALQNPRDMVFSPDGRELATSSDAADHSAAPRLWDVASRRESSRFPGHTGAVRSLAIAPDGRWLASGGDDASVRLWDLEQGALLQSLAWDTVVAPHVAFAPQEQLAVAGGAVRLQAPTRQGWNPLAGFRGDARTIAVSAQGQMLLLSAEGYLSLWDLALGREQAGLPEVVDFTLAREGGKVLLATEDGSLKLWNLDDPSKLRRLTGVSGRPGHLALAEARQLCAWSDEAGSLHVLDLIDREELYVQEAVAATAIAASPDGQQLAVGREDGSIWLLDGLRGKRRAELRGHCGAVRALCYTPDGRCLASGSDDTTVLVWELDGVGEGGSSG